MIKQKEHFHGSDLEKIEKIYGIRKSDIISFAANVNPLGLSPLLRQTLTSRLDVITEYPDREYTLLRNAIGEYTGCSAEHIIMGSGSTELISLFCKILRPQNALIIGPTYSEYEHELSLCKGHASYYELREENGFLLDADDLIASVSKNTDMLILCNPNNPTSGCVCKSDMRRILLACQKLSVTVMVDETYVEFAPDINNVTAASLVAEFDNLIVLRGTSKFFAAPGLRLGYALCSNTALRSTVLSLQNPWSINSLAEAAGQIMFKDTEYMTAVRELINSERQRLYRLYSECGRYRVYQPCANFMLLKILSDDVTSFDLFEKCIKKGMMIRDCATFPYLGDKYIRFCFMTEEANNALAKALIY